MIAQRVSAGFRPPMKTQPRMGRQIPSPYERQYPIASPEPGNAPEHEADKPQSLEAAKVSVIAILESLCFHRFEIRPVCFASSCETLGPQSEEDGRKNRKKTQKDAVPIRPSSPPRTIAKTTDDHLPVDPPFPPAFPHPPVGCSRSTAIRHVLHPPTGRTCTSWTTVPSSLRSVRVNALASAFPSTQVAEAGCGPPPTNWPYGWLRSAGIHAV